jgi:hypothetical protein
VSFIRRSGTFVLGTVSGVTLINIAHVLTAIPTDVIFALVYLGGDVWELGVSPLSSNDLSNGSTVVGSTISAALDNLLEGFPNGVSQFSTPGPYTFDQSMRGKLLELTAAGTFTFNIPDFASSGIPIGATFTVSQFTPGSLFAVSYSSSVFIQGNFRPSTAPYTKYLLTQVAADLWSIDTIYSGIASFVRHYPIFDVSSSPYWTYTGTGMIASTGSGGSQTLIVPLGPFRDDEQISQLTVSILPPRGHSAGPAQLPRWRLYAGGPGALGPPYEFGVDASTTVAAYEVAHNITKTFSATAAGFSFWLEIDNESGTHSLSTGLLIYDIKVTVIPAASA